MTDVLRILALALVALTLAWCEIEGQRSRDAVRIACIEAGGNWSWTKCVIEKDAT